MAGKSYGGQIYNYYTGNEVYNALCNSCSTDLKYAVHYVGLKALLTYNFPAPGLISKIKDDCEDPVKNSITQYTTIYEEQLNSWH